MRPYPRTARINELIKEELSKIIFDNFSFQDSLVTLINVETSKDLLHAKIHLAVFPQNQSKQIIKVLNRDIYQIQQELNKKLKMRPIPKIRLVLDTQAQKTADIEKLLKTAKIDKNSS